jgi:CheY-like chemotaxis protein
MPKILVADDDPSIREYTRLILESAGHEVHEARDGKEALARHAQEVFSMIVLDLFMPEKDGFEVIRELKNSSPNFPVLAISGGWVLDSANMFEIARTLGAEETLSKPFTPTELIRAVTRILNGQRSLIERGPVSPASP